MEKNPDKKIGLSVVLPMYNERDNIKHTLEVLEQNLTGHQFDYEIIVSNDGSTDGSDGVVNGLAGLNKKIRLVGYQKNKGYGCALRNGFKNATKEFILYTDADLPCDISILKDKALLLEKTDCLIGFREHRHSFRREIYSAVYNFLIRAVFGVKIKDVNFSFKLFRGNKLLELELKSKGSFIDAEMMAKSARKGYKIEEVKMEFFPRKHGRSKLSSPGTIVYILYEMIRLYSEIMNTK